MIASDLTAEQQIAVNTAIKTVKGSRPLFRLGGYAGTGKTTVAKHIAEGLDQGMFCAFTGKAAYRLKEKGLANTATIHRTIYDYDQQREKFIKKDEVEGKWFLIDEGSMISCDLWADVQSFGLPVVMLGDPGQLEPIGNDPRLMHEPDIVLEQIHRQAEGNGIIQFATDIRLDQYLKWKTYDDVEVTYGHTPTYKDLKWADIVICGRNGTRLKLNRIIRHQRGMNGLIDKGEKIICLRNNIELGIFNGQILTVEKILESKKYTTKVKCVADDGETLYLPVLNKQFGCKPINIKSLGHDSRQFAIADYGYAITCHKSQGSEWDKVLVIDEQCPLWDAKRWRYTAITRAAKELRYYFK